MRKFWVYIVPLMTLTGCVAPSQPMATKPVSAPVSTWAPFTLSPSQEAAVKASVTGTLKDPESARFGTIAASKDGTGTITVCGLVNAKNSFGGYTGNQPFNGLLFADKFLTMSNKGTDIANNATMTVCAERNIFL